LDITTPAYSITIKVSLGNVPGTLGRFASAIGAEGGNIAAFPGFDARGPVVVREIDVLARSSDHARRIVDAVSGLAGITVLDWWDRTFKLHEGGKIEVNPLCNVADAHDLAMAYTPGVARVCRAIAEDLSLRHTYTIVKNFVAIVTDGTAVLGLGNLGPAAALPVMEGKALLFKEFGGVDAFPICLNAATPDEIVDTVTRIAPSFGGINLEDIAAPAAFEIEERLIEALDIPVFHDDQHGTAIVTLAALVNSLKLVDKAMSDVSVVISGVGAAGVAVGRILLDAGVGEVVGVDRIGAIHRGRDGMNKVKEWFADNTNPDRKTGSLSQVLAGADVFVGVSAPGLLTAADIRTMARDPIVFAMANPDPEIRPEEADGLAAVMATGRSDFSNQINNVLAFPGVFRGALDVCANRITKRMRAAAAAAVAAVVDEDDLDRNYVVPSAFDRRVVIGEHGPAGDGGHQAGHAQLQRLTQRRVGRCRQRGEVVRQVSRLAVRFRCHEERVEGVRHIHRMHGREDLQQGRGHGLHEATVPVCAADVHREDAIGQQARTGLAEKLLRGQVPRDVGRAIGVQRDHTVAVRQLTQGEAAIRSVGPQPRDTVQAEPAPSRLDQRRVDLDAVDGDVPVDCRILARDGAAGQADDGERLNPRRG